MKILIFHIRLCVCHGIEGTRCYVIWCSIVKNCRFCLQIQVSRELRILRPISVDLSSLTKLFNTLSCWKAELGI